MREYEKVLVVDVDNGARFETYVILTDKPGVICVNGAAARLVSKRRQSDYYVLCLLRGIPRKRLPSLRATLDSSNQVKRVV